MGLILAGILVFALIVWFLILRGVPNTEDYDVVQNNQGVIIFASIFICTGLGLGIFVPISGYEEPKMVSTTELVSLRDDVTAEGTNGILYVSISSTNSYTYYVEVDSPYISESQKAYKSHTISSNNVTIVEDDSYDSARLDTYVTCGKKSFWTFAANTEQYEYIFYVPTGTIARVASLG